MSYQNFFDFKGKVVLVTGGGGSIGSEFGRAFAECGAKVVLADLDKEASDEIAMSLQNEGMEVFSKYLNLLDIQSIKNLVNAVVNKHKKIDILCNHAGFNIRKPAIEYTEEEWDKLVGVNLKGLFFTATEVGKEMIKNKSGKIINTASVSATRGHKNLSIYAATKGGIVQLTKVLAHEWAEYGIQVNAIGPGYVLTKQTRQYLSNPEVRKKLLSQIPAGRYGEVSDIASAVLFLASSASDYVTGHTLYIEGGRLID
jgi:NAD(P)-dependent dehydrogenase (short-subunit alcohol dehydrogenase family)